MLELSIIGLKTINNALLKIGTWSMSGNASGPVKKCISSSTQKLHYSEPCTSVQIKNLTYKLIMQPKDKNYY